MGVFTKPETLDSSLEKSMPGKHVVKTLFKPSVHI